MTQVETREYSLAVLIILVLFCWPAALIYYFTRPKVIRYVGGPPQINVSVNQNQPYPPPNNRFCPQCGRTVPNDVRFCPNCGKQLQ